MVGKTIAHYKILEAIVKGGMGEVYRAHDERQEGRGERDRDRDARPGHPAGSGWHRGHRKADRFEKTIRSMGVPQRIQGSPSRPYAASRGAFSPELPLASR